ncbi:hypothetical protein [Methylobacterium sp. C1]|uniref:hypothetical protein n=1 Tax=Methylobacterium sp. C1 TaxID=1479019 RepID=UPI0013311694|nr:hypothetical protein [Methylobacterium sp. C1]
MNRIAVSPGDRFGLFTAVAPRPRDPKSSLQRFLFRCTCGVEKDLRVRDVVRGMTKSCGCSRRGSGNGKFRHGLSRTSEYGIWRHMIQRCTDPEDAAYCNYGARGICVCERWAASVDNFIADMGLRPSSDHSLERVNNDGNYEPGNCRWATWSEQMRNTRANRFVDHNGEHMLLLDACEQAPVSTATVRQRLVAGWDPHRALTTPRDESKVRERSVRAG